MNYNYNLTEFNNLHDLQYIVDHLHCSTNKADLKGHTKKSG